MRFDTATVERLVEQITKEVLIILSEEETSTLAGDNGSCSDCIGQCVTQCQEKIQEACICG